MSNESTVKIEHDALLLGPVRMTFQRTLRIPEEGLHDIPPGLGTSRCDGSRTIRTLLPQSGSPASTPTTGSAIPDQRSRCSYAQIPVSGFHARPATSPVSTGSANPDHELEHLCELLGQVVGVAAPTPLHPSRLPGLGKSVERLGERPNRGVAVASDLVDRLSQIGCTDRVLARQTPDATWRSSRRTMCTG